MSSSSSVAVAVDIGGTFTDLAVRHRDGSTDTTKTQTTPEALEQGVVTALRQAGVVGEDVGFFVHGTTAGLNALLERRYQTVGLLTTRGFRDVYEIGRANRPAMYDLHYHRPPPLVGRRLRCEVTERMSAQGEVLTPLDEASLRESTEALLEAGVGAMAIVLLHSYANPAHELRCEELLADWYPELPVSVSHRIANEWREYERTSTTVVNAAVSSTVDAYLGELESKLNAEGVAVGIHVMQSNGGMTTAERARRQPVNTLLSGPVGGTLAASNAAAEERFRNAIAIDMGGTSFDVSLIVEGKPQLAREAVLEGQPLLLSVVDVHTIGSGGGSVAYASAAGLRVGPAQRRRGPRPGLLRPGGPRADGDRRQRVPRARQHRILPRRRDDALPGARRRRAGTARRRARDGSGAARRRDPRGRERAHGGPDPPDHDRPRPRPARVHADRLRGRGPDARGLPGRAARHRDRARSVLARARSQRRECSTADIARDIAQPYFVRWDDLDRDDLAALVARMRDEGAALMREDGVPARDARYRFGADVRYVGQEHSLTLPFRQLDDTTLREVPPHLSQDVRPCQPRRGGRDREHPDDRHRRQSPRITAAPGRRR